MMSRSIALPVFADLPPYSGGRSAKSASDPGRNRLGAVDHLVVVKVLDIPAKRLEHDPALRVTEHLASGAVPLASLRLQVDQAVGVRQVEFGDRYTFHFDDVVPYRQRKPELADDVEQHHLEPAAGGTARRPAIEDPAQPSCSAGAW